MNVPTVLDLAHVGLAHLEMARKGEPDRYRVTDEGHRQMGEAMSRNAQAYHAVEPTLLHCPALPEGDNSTHHLAPSQARASLLKCSHCGKSEDQIRREAVDA